MIETINKSCHSTPIIVWLHGIEASRWRRFNCKKKDIDDRVKIISIRGFTSNNYANDLMIKAILELSKRSYFKELEFNIYEK